MRADRFTVVRVAREWERFSQRETGRRRVRFDPDGPALLRFSTVLYLRSDRPPEVFRLVCSHWQDSAQNPRHLTAAEIRTTLAPLVTWQATPPRRRADRPAATIRPASTVVAPLGDLAGAANPPGPAGVRSQSARRRRSRADRAARPIQRRRNSASRTAPWRSATQATRRAECAATGPCPPPVPAPDRQPREARPPPALPDRAGRSRRRPDRPPERQNEPAPRAHRTSSRCTGHCHCRRPGDRARRIRRIQSTP